MQCTKDIAAEVLISYDTQGCVCGGGNIPMATAGCLIVRGKEPTPAVVCAALAPPGVIDLVLGPRSRGCHTTHLPVVHRIRVVALDHYLHR